MGGRGSKSDGAGGGKAASKKIKDDFIKSGLNSKFKGVRRDAENGTGAYSYKNSESVGYRDAQKMVPYKIHEKNGNTLVEGLIGDREVVYGNKSESKEIKNLKDRLDTRRDRHEKKQDEIRTTTTYDRWHSNNRKNFDAWFNGGK